MSVPSPVFEHTLRELLAPIADLLSAEGVSEVLINGAEEIYVERGGVLERTQRRFPSDYALLAALRNIAQFVGRDLSVRAPVLEARLPDGSRVEAIIPPASRRGPAVSIRRFQQERFTLNRLVELETVSQETGRLLRTLVEGRKNILIGGGSGTGKTTLLSAFASLASPRDRVVVIEDAAELQLALPHVLQLEAQPPDSEGRGAISVRELLNATLRMRPDRIVIGEIRSVEALDLIQAMTSGHRGCLSTIHGTLPIDSLHRLETMALMSDVEVPVAVLRAQIASAIDIIVQVARTAGGRRRVTCIAEVLHADPHNGYEMSVLFEEGAGQ